MRSDIPRICAVGSGGVTAGFETVNLSGGDIPIATEQAATLKLDWSRNVGGGKGHEHGNLKELHCKKPV